MKNFSIFPVLAVILFFSFTRVQAEIPRYYLPVKVDSSTVKTTNTPCALNIDFQDLLADLNIAGKFDRFSVVIEGKDPSSGEFIPVDYRVGEHYKYGTAGTVYWLIENPMMTEFRIWFDTVTDPPRKYRSYIPAIGVGDELLFNTPESVPLYVMTTNLLVDFNNDGITDALSINHYSDRFGWPYDGILFHPGIEENDKGIMVRDFFRIRYIPEDAEDDEFRFLHARYNFVCPTDWDQDGLVDLFYVSMERDEIHHLTMPENAGLFQSSNYFTFLKNTGRKDISGQPILKETKHYSALAVTHNAKVPAIAVEDLDGDGKNDLIGVKSHSGTHETPIGQAGISTVFFYRNKGVDKNGLPEVAEPVELKTTEGETIFGYHYAPEISFGDVNNDGKIDVIFNNTYVRPHQLLWHENKGGSPPVFAPARQIKGLPDKHRGYRWARWKNGEGLLAVENQDLFVRTIKKGEPVFTSAGGLRETFGPLVQGHQEKPEWIDWDSDGDMDLLAGEAWGRIHLYENIGNQKYPRFKSPVWIQADGKDLEVSRYTVFGKGPHLHPMGYLSVACVDWDRDGLFDLVAPNETNRVYWFKNIGTLGTPKFGKRKQILPDGFTDSKEKLDRSCEISNDPQKSNNGVYPYFDDEPFYWRTRLAIADYTGDGLEDVIALNGSKNLVLYERYKYPNGKLRLKPEKQLYYANGDAIEKPHYFKMRNVDWNEDGLMDIVVTNNLFTRDQRSLLLLKNVGTKEMPVFERPRAFQMWNKVISYSSHGLQPSFVDWDDDGFLDFVGCNESGFLNNNILFGRNLSGAIARDSEVSSDDTSAYRKDKLTHIGELTLEELKETYEQELFDVIIPMWYKKGIDNKYGGFLCEINYEDETFATTDKNVWYQSRGLYTFSHIYRLFERDEKHLQVMEKTKDFLLQHCVDENYNWYARVSRDGKKIIEPKHLDSDLHAVHGFGEYYLATGDEKALEVTAPSPLLPQMTVPSVSCLPLNIFMTPGQ